MADPSSAAELVAASRKKETQGGLALVSGWMRHAFTANLGFKAVAFLMAGSLFILVNSDEDTVVPVSVRLSYDAPREGLTLVEKPPATARVGIKGSRRRLKRLIESNLDPIQVTLTNTGEFLLRAEMIKPLPKGLEVASISPSSVTLLYESTEDKSVVVRPRIIGEPAPGYRIESVTVTPKKLFVRGAESAVARLTELTTAPITVAGLSESRTTTVALEPPAFPAQVLQDEKLTAAAEVSVSVQILIVRASGALPAQQLSVKIIGANVGSSAVAGWNVTPATVSIVLRGYKDVLRTLDADSINAQVLLYPGDQNTRAARMAPVVVAGVPQGVAVEISPRVVRLTPR